MIKTTLLVIIAAVIIGILIVTVPKFLSQRDSVNSQTKENALQQEASPLPTFRPTPQPVTIDQNSHLKDEINKLTVPDFSQDIESLKSELQ